MPRPDDLPTPLKIVEQPEPDDEQDLQDMLAAIRAAKDPDTELITDTDALPEE